MGRAASGASSGVAAAAALLALSACASGPAPLTDATVVYSTIVETNYTPSEVGAAASLGLPVEVVGAPPDGASPEEVAAQLRAPQSFGGRPMALAAQGSEGPRLVVAFGSLGRGSLCTGEARGTVDAGPTLDAAVAYCFDDVLSSSAFVASRVTQGPRDAGFAAAMMQAVREVLPIRNPALDSGRDRPRVRPPR
ncbi:MAG: hypothetical protein AAF763_12395 [Pseudomonadota bacterium]